MTQSPYADIEALFVAHAFIPSPSAIEFAEGESMVLGKIQSLARRERSARRAG